MILVLILGIALLVMLAVLGADEAAPWESRRARRARRRARAEHSRKHG
ncbi:hypothetical protein ACWC0A_18075 [Streptomyces scopuliridis]